MINCRDCKHWLRGHTDDPDVAGDCSLFETDNALHHNARAVAYSLDGFDGRLSTKPDFGCVEGEKK